MLRRQLSRPLPRRRDLKCFVAIMMLLTIVVVGMLIRSQYRYNQSLRKGFSLDDGSEDLGLKGVLPMGMPALESKDEGFARVQSIVRAAYSAEDDKKTGLSSTPPENDTYIKTFRSEFIIEGGFMKQFREFKLPNELTQNVTNSRKKIITWFSVASERLPENLFDEDVFKQCPIDHCRFMRHDVLQEKPDKRADAIIFPGVMGRDKTPPYRTHSEQVFIYYDLDPPIRPTQSFGGGVWNSIFNWTWSYRRDADIWEPAGKLSRLNEHEVKSISHFKSIAKSKSKAKHVAWFVSSCNVPSQRMKYVTELQKYVNVDIYGKCGNKTCPKSLECLEMLTGKYFFYLSFESAICKDFVTDKFLHMFMKGIHVVPVVMGGADYHKFFPEGSYIDVNWFETPKKLADFLRLLMDDKRIYAEFLWRKSHFEFAGPSNPAALCQLCQHLHDLKTYNNNYPDLQAWYRNQQCRGPKTWQ